MNINLETKIRRSDDYLASELDDGIVMMSLENNSYYGLDEIGKSIWDLSEEDISVNDLIVKLMEEYNVEKEQCQENVLSLLLDLQKENIIIVI